MKPDRWLFCLFLATLLLASDVLYRALPTTTRCSGWTHIALQNWRDFGLVALKGRLTTNVAGEGLPAKAQVYAGHQPASLYPAYVAWRLAGGEDARAFYLLVSFCVGLSVWFILGRGSYAVATALLVVFVPGYVRMVPTLDPLDVPVLLALPLLWPVITVLSMERLTAGRIAFCALLITAYASLNWTTLIAFGIVVAYLAAALKGRLRRVILFTVICSLAGGAVLVASLASKAGHIPQASHSGQLARYYNLYLFGPGGYDGSFTVTWSKALTRIVVVNVAALLPLWLWFAAILVKAWRCCCPGQRRALLRPLWPLASAALAACGLRNYFAHHPWMAAPVLLVGMVFSIRLLQDATPCAPEPTLKKRSLKTLGAALACAFCYGLLFLFGFRMNSVQVDRLFEVVRQHTSRSAEIYFAARSEPWLAQNAQRLSETLDRQLLPFPEEGATGEASRTLSGPRYILATQPLTGGGALLGNTGVERSPLRDRAESVLQWYRNHIAKRAKGDRFEVEQTFYLGRDVEPSKR